MTDKVILCFSCGQRNRIAEKSARSLAKCGNCGDALFPVTREPTNPKSRPTAPPYEEPAAATVSPSSGNHHTSSSTDKTATFVFIGIFAALGFSIYSANQPPSPMPTNQRTYASIDPPAPAGVEPRPVATRVPMPPVPFRKMPPIRTQNPGILWNNTGRDPIAPLAIRTNAGENYYIKLVEAFSGQDALAIFVWGGVPIEVDVPLGTYIFRYASGLNWRGEEALFGPGDLTSYSEANSRFTFSRTSGSVNGYTVELIKQARGNLATKNIDRSGFLHSQ